MKRLAAVALAVLGAGLVMIGLLFLVGAGGEPRRLVVATVGLGMGAAAIGLGLRMFASAEATTPARLRAEILEAARRQDGEISEAELNAALGPRFGHAGSVLEALEAAGSCSRHLRSDGVYLVFPELQPRLVQRVCRYCERTLPLNEELERCPSCGGDLTTRVARHSLSEEDVYDMDE